MHTRRPLLIGLLALIAITALGSGPSDAQGPIKIGLVQGLTGPFEVYAKQAVNGFKLGLEYGTGGTNAVLGRKIEVADRGRSAEARCLEAEGDQALRGRQGRPGRGDDVERGGPRDPARGRGVQEGPDRRAGRGRQHHRRALEPLHLPDRPELRAGRDRECPRGGEARGPGRHHRPGLRLRARRGRRLQGRGREARGQGGPRGVHAPGRDRLHRAHPEDHRGAQGQARPQVRLRDLGREGRAVRPAGGQSPRQVRDHARDRGERPRRAEGDEGAEPRGPGRRRLLLLRDPEECGERLAGPRAPEALQRAPGLLHGGRLRGGDGGR